MSDKATRRGLERQLEDLLHFQNALIEAAEPPDDLTPDQLLPWFIERLKMADVGDYESAMAPARAKAAMTAPQPSERSGDGGYEPDVPDGGEVSPLCSDCPPVGYPTDVTRCTPCPRRSGDGARGVEEK